MSTRTVADALVDGFVNGLRRAKQTFREHVMTCRDCIVDPDGAVWACPVGCELRQRERKARL